MPSNVFVIFNDSFLFFYTASLSRLQADSLDPKDKLKLMSRYGRRGSLKPSSKVKMAGAQSPTSLLIKTGFLTKRRSSTQKK